ncbi:MAG: amidohydrolase family protein [Armatimonadetes bacterium]|nr:amidohydrolase family protein [Armatimonadota bacterium]
MTTAALLADQVFSDGQVLTHTVVIVDGGTIAGTRPRDRFSPREVDTVYDLTGCTVLPGLIDAHVHFGSEVDHRPYARLFEASNLKLIKSVVDARNLLEAGFTAARDVGGRRAIDLKRAIDLHEIPGPRLRCSGRILTSTGGLEDHAYIPQEWVAEISDLVEPCDGTEGCARAVRNQRRNGADLIKVFTTGADTVQQFSDEELRAIVAEAARLGMKVSAHAYGGPAVSAAVRAGCYTLEHGSWLTEADCALMAEQRTILLPDLAFAHLWVTRGVEYGVPQSSADWERARIKDMRESAAMAHAMGVRLATGSDFGLRAFARHGRDNALALLLLHDAGIPAPEVLRAATVNAAAAMELQHTIGKIEPGFTADLVAVRGNPVEHLLDVMNVRFVMKDGRIALNTTAA